MTAVTRPPVLVAWRYRIDPLPGGGSTVRQRFTHGPGASYLRQRPKAPPGCVTAARRDGCGPTERYGDAGGRRGILSEMAH